MGLYENVKEAAKNKGYSINKLEQELGFARSYIGKFKTITPSVDAQEMFEDEDMRSLFHMKRTMPPDRFKAHMDFMKNLYDQEKESNF